MKIEALTKQQEKKLVAWREEWWALGVSTDPVDQGRAEAALTEMYAVIGKPRPRFVWCDSPAGCILSRRRESGKAGKPDTSGCFHWGGHEAYWVAFYRFCEAVVGVQYTKESSAQLRLHEELVRSCGWVYPHDGVCFVSRRPTEIHWTDHVEHKDRRIHCETGPAVAYADDWQVYALHGVTVPEWLVETPAEEIDVQRLKEIENVEVRREFIRRVGIERVYQALGGVELDSETFESATGKHDYTLVGLRTWGDEEGARPYLKMENPSLPGTYHLERVPVGTVTVRDALNFRNSLTEDQIDDVAGSEWYQQGDVILRPRGAQKFQRFPKVLT
jgi:hypothetical protein